MALNNFFNYSFSEKKERGKDTAKIAVFERDSKLLDEFLKIKSKNDDGSPLYLRGVVKSELTSMDQIDMIYVANEYGFLIDEILNWGVTNNVLVVSEGLGFGESMVNFVVIDRLINFELNEKNATNAGIKFSPILNMLGNRVESEDQWTDIISKMNYLLGEKSAKPSKRDLSIAKMKTLFIYNFLKYIEWNEENKHSDIKVTVLGENQLVYNELLLLSKKKSIKGRAIKVGKEGKLENIKESHLIYVDNQLTYNIKDVVKKGVDLSALVVSEGFEYGQSMINFIKVDNLFKFELNEFHTQEAGLTLSETLKSLAIKTEQEWGDIVSKLKASLKSDAVTITKEDLKNILKEYNSKLDAVKRQNEILAKKEELLILKNKELIKMQSSIEFQSKTLEEKKIEIRAISNKYNKQLVELDKKEKLTFAKQKQIAEQNKILQKQKVELTNQELLLSNSEKKVGLQSIKIDSQKRTIYIGVGVLFIILVLAFFSYKGYRDKKKSNLIITKQKEAVEEAHKEIKDSIAYAKRIQSAILPPAKLVKEYLKESFILYKPKDIVAGDFYWMEHVGDKVLFAAADCTGHGVPGAMVSVVCNNGLNRSVREYGLTDPGQILDKTREIVIKEFEKSEDEVKDGMDIALCSIEGTTLKYAGAHNPLWIIRQGEIIETKANKQPIGQFDNPAPYFTHTFELESGDAIYVFSDGYVDQFGGEKGKKFKSKAFRELLLSIQDKPMEEQKVDIDEAFEAWKGSLEQIDDVCVIGVKV